MTASPPNPYTGEHDSWWRDYSPDRTYKPDQLELFISDQVRIAYGQTAEAWPTQAGTRYTAALIAMANINALHTGRNGYCGTCGGQSPCLTQRNIGAAFTHDDRYQLRWSSDPGRITS